MLFICKFSFYTNCIKFFNKIRNFAHTHTCIAADDDDDLNSRLYTYEVMYYKITAGGTCNKIVQKIWWTIYRSRFQYCGCQFLWFLNLKSIACFHNIQVHSIVLCFYAPCFKRNLQIGWLKLGNSWKVNYKLIRIARIRL